ncbi:hypothetical protein [Leptospira borgpetersenii]|uniref:Uncharacterized protein n=1 Tax=Leptospira borgpetersenii serovar Javanica str. UI 09931 TaxID=1049767 RepID=A0AAV3JCH4_LEPBO|nr:hypothetical protein [Leptospira borgpetersenii]AXX14291.1 hypothetical protein C4Q31_00665 [Leptospira borgpetersenii serovar Ceylonica]EKQ91940.1 hypothetical protein LEP1GSC101_2982 [Leptospira borgpetersenii str. UI 09149]EMN59517.1 hypothetical protein LEP1GSC090_1619 [Leptospira borgpetersenii serovar Javanica str. MK146]EPG58417.1 hypothetical protein LEP1GSC103_2637 [Leptospira borgpetersenii serovar Javanica str. UI 09931]PTM49264.1 hypothetical protein CLV95_104163 [Leptospira bor
MKVGPGNKVQLGKDESLHYVGHGQLESAPASTSVLHVISHELGHVAEFRSEAMRDRAEIRSLNMKIHYEFRNGKLVAVAGETEAVTARKSEETTRKNETSWDESSKKENVPKKEEKSYISSSGLEDKEKQILLEIRKIESELQTFEAKKKVENEQRFDSVRKVELEERKRKLEMALNQEKLKMILEDTLNTFKELIDKQARTSLRILNANASVKTGNIFDAKA